MKIQQYQVITNKYIEEMGIESLEIEYLDNNNCKRKESYFLHNIISSAHDLEIVRMMLNDAWDLVDILRKRKTMDFTRGLIAGILISVICLLFFGM